MSGMPPNRDRSLGFADRDFIARYFRFAQEGTNYRQETVGGITTFLAMAYIMFVNPAILSDTGMDKQALFTATGLTAIMGCLLMGLVARYPVAVAPSMGLNAFFAYSVVQGMGIPWQNALVGAMLSGVIFVLITWFRLRALILEAIPTDLKTAAACGVGLFVAFIGFKEAGLIVSDPDTLVTLGQLSSPATLLSILGLGASLVLMIRRIPGALFLGMALTSAVGVGAGIIDMPGAVISAVPGIQPLFGAVFEPFYSDPGSLWNMNMLAVVLTFLLVEFFDTSTTLIAVAGKAGLLKNNRLKRARPALLADSSSVVLSSIIGSSPSSVYIESAAGVASGARTGFAALVIAGLFAGALFFSPLLHVVTASVTAPVLIIVGVLMVSGLSDIRWQQFEVAAPAFLMMLAMPLTYSIANGIAIGIVVYPLTMIMKGRIKELHPLLYLLALLFILYFAFLA